MADLVFGIRLTADGSGYVGTVRVAKEETEKLGAAGRQASGGVQQLDTTMKQSQASAVALGAALGIVAVQAVRAFVGWGVEGVRAAAALDDLHEVTGSTVEDLSRLTNIAKVSGTEAAAFGDIIGRLAVRLSGTDEESTKAGKALAALGIQARDPAKAMEELAKKFANYADDANKAAYANTIFGKGGEKLLPLLKDIADQTDIAATVTAKQAEESEKLEKQLRLLSVQFGSVRDSILGAVLPALNDLIEQFRVGIGIAGSFWEALKLFGSINPFRDLAGNLSVYRKAVDDLKAANADMYAQEGLSDAQREREIAINNAEIETIGKKIKLLELQERQEYKTATAGLKSAEDRGFDPRKSAGAPPSGGGPGRAKKEVDEYAKALENVTKIAADAERQLAGVFDPEETTRAKKALDDLANSPSWAKIPKAQQEILKGILAGASATELEARAQAKAIKADIDGFEQMAKLREAFIGKQNAAKEATAALITGLDLETRSMFMGNEERERFLAISKLELERKERLIATDEELAKRITAVTEALAGRNAAAALKKSLDDQAAAFKQTYDDISNTITDALMTGFEGGKGWAKNFLKSLKDMFANLVLRPVIQAAIAPLAGGLTSLVSGGAQAGGGGLGNVLNLGGSAASGLSKLFGGSDFTAALAGDAYLPAALGAAGEGAAGIVSLLGGFGLDAILPGAGIALAIGLPLIKKLFGKKKKKKKPAAPTGPDPALVYGDALSFFDDSLDDGVARDAKKQLDGGSTASIEKLRQMGDSVRDLAAKLDGSVGSVQALAGATQQYRQSAADALAAVRGIQISLTQMFASTREQVEFAGLDNQAAYDLYKTKGATLLELVSQSDDPALIEQMQQKINGYFLSAFNLLDPTEQVGRKKEFLDSLNNVETVGNDRLETIAGTIQTDSAGPFGAAKDALEKHAAAFGVSVVKQEVVAASLAASVAEFTTAVKEFGESTIGVTIEPSYSAVGGNTG